MAETNNKKQDYDIFIANKIYPDAGSIFSLQLQPLEEIKDNCTIVLDTNVLLAPYILGKEDLGKENLLEQCRNIYGKLVSEERLFIPGQVAREFAKNRIEKLAELYQQLSRKRQQIQKVPRGNYPLLYALEEYKKLEGFEKELNQKIKEYQELLGEILAHIQTWQLNDPVRSLYGDIFNEGIIRDPKLDENIIKEDLNRRKVHKIAPGYKDSAKDDEGIGDLIIWRTILEIGKSKNQSVVFVSGDEKPDWFRQSENVALFLRHELIDEFWRESKGHSLHVIKFSRFLELYGANEKVVQNIRKEEGVLDVKITKAVSELPIISDSLEDIIETLESFVSLWDESNRNNLYEAGRPRNSNRIPRLRRVFLLLKTQLASDSISNAIIEMEIYRDLQNVLLDYQNLIGLLEKFEYKEGYVRIDSPEMDERMDLLLEKGDLLYANIVRIIKILKRL